MGLAERGSASSRWRRVCRRITPVVCYIVLFLEKGRESESEREKRIWREELSCIVKRVRILLLLVFVVSYADTHLGVTRRRTI